MPVGSNKRRNFTPVKPAKQRCVPKVQRAWCQTLRGWRQQQQQYSVTRLDLTTQMIPAQTLMSVLVWRMTKKLNWNNNWLRQKKLVWKVTYVPFSGTAMWLQLCSTKSTAEQLAQKCLKKYLFLSTEKWLFHNISLKVLSFYQKMPTCIFSQNYATIPYSAVSH